VWPFAEDVLGLARWSDAARCWTEGAGDAASCGDIGRLEVGEAGRVLRVPDDQFCGAGGSVPPRGLELSIRYT
jgi:hypothetical protein